MSQSLPSFITAPSPLVEPAHNLLPPWQQRSESYYASLLEPNHALEAFERGAPHTTGSGRNTVTTYAAPLVPTTDVVFEATTKELVAGDIVLAQLRNPENGAPTNFLLVAAPVDIAPAIKGAGQGVAPFLPVGPIY